MKKATPTYGPAWIAFARALARAAGYHANIIMPRRKPMLLDQLHAQRDAIERACRQYGARRIRVFGSVARREDLVNSDVDFLVDLPRGYNLLAQRMPLQRRLTEIAGRRIDLIPEHELSPLIRDRVLREAVEL